MRCKPVDLLEMLYDTMSDIMKINMLRKLALFPLLLIITACSSSSIMTSDKKNHICTSGHFIQLDEQSRKEVLPNCTPEQQIDLYISWARATYPTNTDHVVDLAMTGEDIVPYLINRLEKRNHLSDEIFKPDFMMILETMDRLGYYEVSENKNVMDRIQIAIENMESSYAKSWSKDIFSEMKNR